jgi:ssDNA-binding Zn-finger/Zn-ribbon topoisomerase 1
MNAICPKCEKTFYVPIEYIGKSIKCESCRTTFLASTRNMTEESADACEVRCPKCHSTEVSSHKAGYSGPIGLIGFLLFGWIGLLFGTAGSRKVEVTCLNCGKKWYP